jgi:hypothetical protein
MSGSQQTLPLSTIFPINPATNLATHSYSHHNSSYAARSLRRLLVWLPAPGPRVGTQPQCDVLRLHRILYHPYQVVAEGAQICLVT